MCQSYHLSTLYHPLLYNYILVWLKKWPPGAAPAFNSNQLNIPKILGQEFLLLSVLCYCDIIGHFLNLSHIRLSRSQSKIS